MEIVLNSLFTGDDPQVLIGAVLGNTYINNHGIHFADPIEQGQELSTRIDILMENSGVYESGMNRLSPRARKFGKRIIRLYFDHLLARNWNKYFDNSYQDYCDELIKTLKEQLPNFPHKPKRVVNRIVRKKMIHQLATLNGLDQYVASMIMYNSYNSNIQASIVDLANHYDAFNEDFNRIFPLIQEEMNAFAPLVKSA